MYMYKIYKVKGFSMANESRYDSMKYNYCGKSGLKLPAISLGLWQNFGESDVEKNMHDMIAYSFDNGITHFDLANNYGPPVGRAEENFGKIFHSDFKSYRNEMVISSKAGYFAHSGPYGDFGSRKYIIESANESLKRMNLEYVDIFYHHRPDPNTPMEETIMALDSLVKSGKALYVGVSNYSKVDLEKALPIFRDLKTPFIANQVALSLVRQEKITDGCTQFAYDNGIGLTIYSPLAQGLLTNKYLNGVPENSRMAKDVTSLKKEILSEEMIKKLNLLNDVAKSRSQTLAQLALSWVYAQPAIASIIIGASKISQIQDNLGVLKSEPLTKKELATIDSIWNI